MASFEDACERRVEQAKEGGDKMKSAEQFLIEMLSAGPIPSKDVMKQAREGYGITDDTPSQGVQGHWSQADKCGGWLNGAWMWAPPIANSPHLGR